jgi:hypothetical protein
MDNAKTIKRIIKALHLPSGGQFSADFTKYSWEKKGGFAGERSLKNINYETLKLDSTIYGGSPDGSCASNRYMYAASDDTYTLQLVYFYGQTRRDNRYTATLTLSSVS